MEGVLARGAREEKTIIQDICFQDGEFAEKKDSEWGLDLGGSGGSDGARGLIEDFAPPGVCRDHCHLSESHITSNIHFAEM